MSMQDMERLMVRLTGDDSEYTAALDRAEAETRSTVQAIERATADMSRRQAAMMREGARLTEALMDPVQRYSARVARLGELLRAGAIKQYFFNRAVQELNQTLPHVIAATQAREDAERRAAEATAEAVQQAARASAQAERIHNDALREAATITQAVMTAEEEYAAAVGRANAMLRQGFITQETYNRTVAQLQTTLPVVRDELRRIADEERAHNQTMEEGRRTVQSLLTPQERYTQTVHRLAEQLRRGAIDWRTYVRGIHEARQAMPHIVAATRDQERAMERGRQVIRSLQGPYERYATAVRELADLHQRGAIGAGVYRRALAAEAAQLPHNRAHQERHANAVRRASDIMERAQTELQRYNVRLRELDSLHQRGYLSSQQHAIGIRALAREFDFMGHRIRAMQGVLGQFGGTLQTLGIGWTIGITTPVTMAGIATAKSFGQFEQGLADIEAQARPTQEELKKLEAASMRMSKELRVAPQGINQAFEELLKAGAPVEKVLGGAARAAVQFAKVGTIDFPTAAVTLTDVMNVFGTDAVRSVNLLSSAADASSIAIHHITESFQMASAVAGNAEQDLETAAAAIALLGKNALKGSDAGTSLKTFFLRLMAPVDQSQEMLNKYDIRVRRATGGMRPLVEIIGELETKLGHLNAQEQDAALFKIFGTDAIRAAQIFLRNGTKGFDDMTGRMRQALTVSQKYEIMMNTLNGRWQALVASLKRAAVNIGMVLAPELSKTFDQISGLLDRLANWVSRNKELTATLVKMTIAFAAMGPPVLLLGRLAMAANSMTSLFMTARAATDKLGVAMNLMGAGAIAARAGLVALYAYGLVKVMEFAYNAEGSIQAFNKAMSDSAKLAEQLNAQLVARGNKSIFDGQQIQDAGTKVDYFRNALAKAEKEAAGLQGLLKNALDQADPNKRFEKGSSVFSAWFGKDRKLAEENSKEIEARLEAQQTIVQKLREELTQAEGAAKAFEEAAVGIAPKAGLELFAEDIDEMVAGLKQSIAAIGLDKETAKVEALAAKMLAAGLDRGAIEDALGEARKLAEEFEKRDKEHKETTKLAEDVAQLNEKLQQQIDMFGKTGAEAEIYALKIRGASDAQLAAAQKLADEHKALEQKQKDEQEVARIKEKHLSPDQKFAKVQAELDRLFKAGAIGVDDYQKELEEARVALFKLQNQYKAGIDSLEAGSIEEAMALADYREMLRVTQLPALPGAPPALGPDAPPDEVARIDKGLAAGLGPDMAGPQPLPLDMPPIEMPAVGEDAPVADLGTDEYGYPVMTDLTESLKKIEENTRKDDKKDAPVIQFAPLALQGS